MVAISNFPTSVQSLCLAWSIGTCPRLLALEGLTARFWLSLLSSVEDAGELALGEGASQKLVGDGIDVSMLEEEHLVHLEVREARLVEVGEGLLEDLLGLSLNLLEVKLLGRLGIDAQDALGEEIAGLVVVGDIFGVIGSDGLLLLEKALRLFHFFVSSGFNNVLSNHLDRLLNGLSNNRALSDRMDAEDVAADLVAKLDAASLQTEECSVAALLFRGLALN